MDYDKRKIYKGETMNGINIIMNLICLGALLGYLVAFLLVMVIKSISDDIDTKREVQLLNKKKAPFVMDYIQFKKELNCWKETKTEYKL
jgi:hypothetical protein